MPRNLMRLFCWVGSSLALLMGGCECREDIGAREAIIDRPTIRQKDDDADPPAVIFPHHLRTTDFGLNRFITDALNVCREGDYDRFRQLFSTAHAPPEQVDFERIWYGVGEVEVTGLYEGPPDPPTWYATAVVRLRQPDGRGRQQREAVVAVFQEEGEWRLGTAPQGVVRRIRAAQEEGGDERRE